MPSQPKVMIIQFGDYHAALEARDNGIPETYRAQYYSLDAVEAMAPEANKLIIGLDEEPKTINYKNYRIINKRYMPQTGGIRFHLQAMQATKDIITQAEIFQPTHLIIRSPGWVLAELGTWALKNKVHVLPVLADYYPPANTWRALKQRKELDVMKNKNVPLVGNHNIPASITLAKAGVPAEKIIPWDWPPESKPTQLSPKSSNGTECNILYAGLILKEKGVGDLLNTAALLQGDEHKDITISANIVGDGPLLTEYQELANSMGLSEIVSFHGKLPNKIVRKMMRDAHIVVVPSRHNYPEGLPNVIYEAFETRTPVVCSDHPTFTARLSDGNGCKFFKAGDCRSLYNAIIQTTEPENYKHLSATTAEAWEGIQCPVSFGDLLTQWMQWTDSGKTPECLSHSLKIEMQEK